MAFPQSVRRRSLHHVPGSRRMGTSVGPVHNETEPVIVPDLPFLRKPSYLHKMCPLVNFERKKSAFKKYQASLVSYCHSYAQNQSNVHAAVFDVIEGLNISSSDPTAVYFAIIQKIEGKEKALLCGLLVSVELPPELEDHFHHEMYTYYPLMILTGNQKLRKIVQLWFQKEFQGKSTLLNLSPVDLSWVLSLWTGKVATEDKLPITLAYAVTEEGINQVEIEIEPKDLKKLWDMAHPDSEDEEFTIKELTDFIGELEAFIYHAFKLKLGMLKLSKVMTTVASVSSAGAFKLHSQEHIVDVLRLLCNFSTEQLMNMWRFLPQSNNATVPPSS